MTLPEAGPGFADQDAVAGVAGVVAQGDGLVEAESADLVGEHGDILRAVVGDSSEAVAVDEDLRGGIEAFIAREGTGVHDEAVGDAAEAGKVLASSSLQLFGGGAVRDDEPPDAGGQQDDGNGDGSSDAGVVPDCIDGWLAKRLPEFGVEEVRGLAETGNHSSDL